MLFWRTLFYNSVFNQLQFTKSHGGLNLSPFSIETWGQATLRFNCRISSCAFAAASFHSGRMACSCIAAFRQHGIKVRPKATTRQFIQMHRFMSTALFCVIWCFSYKGTVSRDFNNICMCVIANQSRYKRLINTHFSPLIQTLRMTTPGIKKK